MLWRRFVHRWSSFGFPVNAKDLKISKIWNKIENDFRTNYSIEQIKEPKLLQNIVVNYFNVILIEMFLFI
jgi:hypothetical protein